MSSGIKEGQAKILKTEPLDQGKWTQLRKISWRDQDGKDRIWECATRKTRGKNGVDAVSMIAILEKDEPEIILEKQFRPPANNIMIECPAGLLDEGESPEECAVRELYEETGYHGTAVRQSSTIFNDPGFSNCTMQLVTVHIDLRDKRNQDPKQELDAGEHIEIFTAKLHELDSELHELARQGYAIDARLQHYAEGIAAARQYKL